MKYEQTVRRILKKCVNDIERVGKVERDKGVGETDSLSHCILNLEQ